MFGLKLFSKKDPTDKFERITAQLNARLQPMKRGDYFEDPLLETLESLQMGEVTGGGTQLVDGPAGIEYCDVEISVKDISENTIEIIINRLKELGAPKGSKLTLHSTGKEIQFGEHEGLGLFLDINSLSTEVLETYDITQLLDKINDSLEGIGSYRDNWQSDEEIALYFYGINYEKMKNSMAEIVNDHPLCENSRYEQIA